MADLIASARSMTTYSDSQYVAVGFPKGGLTPATITAMVGFSQGEGLQMNPMVTAALGKMQSGAASIFSGAGGNATILSAAGVSFDTPSTDVAGDISKMVSNAAAFGVSISPSAQSELTNVMSVSSKLSGLSTKIMAGGPAAFMSKFNAARGHIADAIELKKVTAFTANQTLESFGSGMKKMSSLSSNGLGGVMGNMKAAAGALLAAGPAADLANPGSIGSAAGLITKLADSKLANSTGITNQLKQVGVKLEEIGNPANAAKISKVMGSMSDPKAIKDVADQLGVSPPGGLPPIGKQSFASLTAANPFAGVPSYTGADSSLNTDAASTLLSGAPAPIGPSPVEPSADPAKWTEVNTLSSNPATSKQEKIDAIDLQLQALSTEFLNMSAANREGTTAFIDAQYALDFSKAGVLAERQSLADKFTAEFGFAKIQALFDKANELGKLAQTLPKGSSELEKWAFLRNTNIENLLRLADSQYKNLSDIRKDIVAKVKAAGGS